MTKFSEDLIKKIQDFYHEGKKQKKFQGDKSFTIDDGVLKFGLLPNQIKRILYIKKSKK